MVKVIITEELFLEIKKKFNKTEANKIVDLLESLEQNPKKGKEITSIGKMVLKEIKYGKFRFYFITEGYKIKFLLVEELSDLIIKFMRMSDKKNQQSVIEDIKKTLRFTKDAVEDQ